jgi:hypothetical protein
MWPNSGSRIKHVSIQYTKHLVDTGLAEVKLAMKLKMPVTNIDASVRCHQSTGTKIKIGVRSLLSATAYSNMCLFVIPNQS